MLIRDVAALLRCPACGAGSLQCAAIREGAADGILDGVLWCSRCRAWYAVEDGLLELLAGGLAYRDDRRRFWEANAPFLKRLDLRPDKDQPQPAAADPRATQQTHFDWYAANESQSYCEYEQTPFWTAVDRLTYAPWRREIRRRGGLLLDIGCAQGRSSFKFMDLDVNIVGIDISKCLVRQAIERYRNSPHRATATFLAADASLLPLSSGCFDYVLVYGVLHHLPNPAKTCVEVARVLRAGGVYFGSENNQTVFRVIFEILQRISPIWHEEAGPEAVISPDRVRSWFAPCGMSLAITTTVFLPPHLINLTSHETAYRLLKATDWLAQAIPVLKKNGGLIVMRGVKTGGGPSTG